MDLSVLLGLKGLVGVAIVGDVLGLVGLMSGGGGVRRAFF